MLPKFLLSASLLVGLASAPALAQVPASITDNKARGLYEKAQQLFQRDRQPQQALAVWQQELALALGPDIDLAEARRLIGEEILANPNTLHRIAPEILVSGITTSGYDLKVQFWINNIRQEDVLKSATTSEMR